MKWATKLAIKRKAKGKRREREKTRNKFEKKFKFWLVRRKTEKLVITSKQKIMSLVLEISFLVIPILTGRRTVQTGEFGLKCRFFAGELAGDKELSCWVIRTVYKNWLVLYIFCRAQMTSGVGACLSITEILFKLYFSSSKNNWATSKPLQSKYWEQCNPELQCIWWPSPWYQLGLKMVLKQHSSMPLVTGYIFSMFKKEDLGSYNCIADNGHGTAQALQLW